MRILTKDPQHVNKPSGIFQLFLKYKLTVNTVDKRLSSCFCRGDKEHPHQPQAWLLNFLEPRCPKWVCWHGSRWNDCIHSTQRLYWYAVQSNYSILGVWQLKSYSSFLFFDGMKSKFSVGSFYFIRNPVSIIEDLLLHVCGSCMFFSTCVCLIKCLNVL